MKKHIGLWFGIRLATAFIVSTMLAASAVRADDESQIKAGFDIVAQQFGPNFLNMAGKNRALVGLGSYLVNTTGCSDCHTYPNWATGGNPYLGQKPEQINTARYMAGGRPFIPPGVVSANITPDQAGNPAGLTLAEFIKVIRTGHDPDQPSGVLLQVMPWPLYRFKTDRDLTAIYEYLRAIPSVKDP
jgi:hypothetical protein